MAANAGELTFRLRAETAGLDASLARASQSFDRVTASAKRSNVHFEQAGSGSRKLIRALEGIALSSIGLDSKLGRLAATFLSFSAGGAITLGVVAGIAAIGAAWDKLTEKTKRAREASEAAIKTSLTFGEPGGKEVFLQPQLEARRDLLKSKLAEETTGYDPKTGKRIPVVQGAARTTMEDELRGITAALNRLALSAKDAKSEWDQFSASLASGRLTERQKELIGIMTGLEALRQQPGLAPSSTAGRPYVSDTGYQGFLRNQVSGDAVLKGLEAAKKRFPIVLRPDPKELSEIQRIGADMGGELVAGILQAITDAKFSFGSLLKGLFITAAQTAVRIGITAALTAPSGGVGAGVLPFAGPGGIGFAPATPPGSAGLSLDVSGLPPARDPFSITRDADWLRVMKESQRVARQGGFR